MGTFRTTAFLLTFTLMGACNQGPLFDEIPQSQYDRFKGRNAGFHVASLHRLPSRVFRATSHAADALPR